MTITDSVKELLRNTLQLGNRVDRFNSKTPLFGSLPEFDSMAVAAVVAALEERFAISIDDGDITAETFATVGSLSRFVERKLAR